MCIHAVFDYKLMASETENTKNLSEEQTQIVNDLAATKFNRIFLLHIFSGIRVFDEDLF
jgi:hypothetical protein